jgi:NAD(P)-dependent dehydrogenase (short-subunit alcohol dehydrogenase family)
MRGAPTNTVPERHGMSPVHDGRIAFITGGSRGIGLAIAREVLTHGARVAITARREESLRSAVEELSILGDVRGFIAHAGDENAVERAFDAASRELGVPDVLVNSAASNPVFGDLIELEPGALEKVLRTNVEGYWLAAREFSRRLRPTGRPGVIVNVSSIAARSPPRGLGAYAISKAAVDMLTRVLAAELAPSGIRVLGVAPGIVRTKFSEALWNDPGREAELRGRIPAGRLGEPEDVARTVSFLIGPGADYIYGETIGIDGGLSGGG